MNRDRVIPAPLPNTPGQSVEIGATTGRPDGRGQHRVYECTSAPLVTQDCVLWKVDEILPQSKRTGSWFPVMRSTIALHRDITDAWGTLSRLILERFSSPARVALWMRGEDGYFQQQSGVRVSPPAVNYTGE